MESVWIQEFKDFEFIIIDGGSDDGSRALIEKEANNLQYWVSEKDNGIYHAMNKGIEKAAGEYLLFLNSGDVLLEAGSLANAFSYCFTEDIVYCDVRNNLNGKIISFPEEIRFSYFYRYSLNHQSSFIKRQLFIDYGLYNDSLQIVSDWEFFMRIFFIHNRSSCHLAFPLIEFDYSAGLSTSNGSNEKIEVERRQILHNSYSRFLADYAQLTALQNSKAHHWLSRFLNNPLFKKCVSSNTKPFAK